jgi:hypothetical protein
MKCTNYLLCSLFRIDVAKGSVPTMLYIFMSFIHDRCHVRPIRLSLPLLREGTDYQVPLKITQNNLPIT